jgi:hypothetical protein
VWREVEGGGKDRVRRTWEGRSEDGEKGREGRRRSSDDSRGTVCRTVAQLYHANVTHDSSSYTPVSSHHPLILVLFLFLSCYKCSVS